MTVRDDTIYGNHGRRPIGGISPYEDASAPFEAQTMLAVVRRQRWLILSGVIFAVVAALGLSMLQSERYRASSELLLARPLGSDELTTAGRANELRVIESGVLAEAVTERLGFEPAISVTAIDDSDVVRISATSDDPAAAATIANTYAEVYLSERRQRSLEQLAERRVEIQSRYDAVTQQLAELTAPLDALDAEIVAAEGADDRQVLEDQRTRLSDDIAAQRQSLIGQQATYAQELNELLIAQSTLDSTAGEVLSEALAPSTPYQPAPLRNALSAVVLGGVLAIGLAFLRERLDDSIKGSDHLRGLTQLPVLGTVPDLGSSPAVVSGNAEHTRSSGELVEAFRMVRTAVTFIAIEQPIESIAVTSADRGEGKTMTALNLARTMAWEGRSVLLVEADLRRPSLAKRLAITGGKGLADVLLQDTALDAAITGAQGWGMSVLVAGGRPPNAAELLGSSHMHRIQEKLAADYDLVIYDLPPLLPVSDALVMSKQVDAVILVASEKVSKVGNVTTALDMLQDSGVNVIGAVLNRAQATARYYGDDS